MKAAIVLRPGELAVRDLPMPVPGPYQMLCRIRYGATCTATDQHILDQSIPFPVPLPTILGQESVGEVVEVGRKVRHFRVGDRITRVGAPAYPELGVHSGWGGFAEYGLAGDALAMQRDGLPEREWLGARVNRRIPEDIDLKSAPMMITWRETLSYISRMGMKSGMRVLIAGTGGNGLSFVRHAANMGAELVACVGSASREAQALQCGAGAFFSYKDPDLAGKLAPYGEKGFHLLIDAVGHAGGLNAYLPLLAPGAVVGIYGIEGEKQMQMNPLLARHSFRFYRDGYAEYETHARVVEDMRLGRLDAAPFYDHAHPFPLADIALAFAKLKTHSMVKALIQM